MGVPRRLKADVQLYRMHGTTEPDSEERRLALAEFIEAGKVERVEPGSATAGGGSHAKPRWHRPGVTVVKHWS